MTGQVIDEVEATVDSPTVAELTYDEKIAFVNAIAEPLATRKLTKKCYKLVRKASREKAFLRAGKKDVERRIRKGETGIVIFAGDVAPIDIISHLPAICEDNSIPYIYVPSRRDLGASVGVKRGILAVLVRKHTAYADLYDEMHQKISDLALINRVQF